MLDSDDYDVNDIGEDCVNYNNNNNHSIKPFASYKEDVDDYSLFPPFKKSIFANEEEEEGQFQIEEVEEGNETPEIPFTHNNSGLNFINLEEVQEQPPERENIIPYDRNTTTERMSLTEIHDKYYYSDFQPFPSQNLNDLEVAQLQQPKQENIIPCDRNTTTDRMRFTERPIMHFNSDFQPLPSPNLNNSEAMPLQPPKQENIIPYDRNTNTDRMRLTKLPMMHFSSDFQPLPSPNLNNSEIMPQQPSKQENIIPYDRSTTTDRMRLTEIPNIDYNRDFQLSRLPNLKNSEVISQKPPKRENIITYDRNTTTDRTKTQQMDQTKKVIKERIFNIKKVKRNMGPKPKGYANVSGEKIHTRDEYDNIIIKIKRALHNHSVKYVNKSLKKSHNPVLRSLKLKKVKNSVILVHKKEDNLELLEMDLEGLFSSPISAKYKKDKKDHNIKTIEKILKVGDKEINDILKTSIETIVNVYNHKIKNKLFEDFPTIDDDISKFKGACLDDDYIKKYIYVAEHFKEIIEKIAPRRRRKI